MKTSKFAVTSGFLSIVALLLLMPTCAAAQRLANGWYEVEAKELTVRNALAKYVMGTVLAQNGMGRPDKFYIRLMNPGSKWAWGYAQGEDFQGCGWVYTYRTNTKRSLTRMNAQPPGAPSCSQYEGTRPYEVPPGLFASRYGGGKYTNINPSDNGSGANIIGYDIKDTKIPVYVYGNYVGGAARTRLNRDASGTPQRLKPNHRVCWRYFTQDRKFVLVNFKGVCRAIKTPRGAPVPLAGGKWGFVRCAYVVPDPRDLKDKARFESRRCVLTP